MVLEVEGKVAGQLACLCGIIKELIHNEWDGTTEEWRASVVCDERKSGPEVSVDPEGE